MDADRAAAELHQRQAGGAGLRLGQAGAGPGQVFSLAGACGYAIALLSLVSKEWAANTHALS